MVGFSFQDSSSTTLHGSVNLDTIKTVVYEDSAGKYTFGVDDSTNAFKTFKYEPSSGAGAGTAVDYSALATQFMSVGIVGTLLGQLTTIDTNVGAINSNVGTVKNDVDAIKAKTEKLDLTNTNTGAGTLGEALKSIQDKTDKLDLTGNAQGTLAEALGKLAKTTDLTPLAKTTELDPLATAASIIALGTKVAGIEDKTKLIPTDFQTRLNALNPTSTDVGSLGEALGALDTKVGEVKAKTEKLDLTNTNTGAGTLGEALKGIKDKTDKLDPTATTAGTLGEALGELAKANQLPADLTERLNALKPDITGTPAANSLGATLKEIKDKTDKLDPTATTDGTLGKALSELAKAQKLLELDGKVGEVKAKTDNLDPEDTAEGTLGKALETISTEATANLNALTARLNALDLTDSEGTLGGALGKLATAQELSKLDGKLTTTEGKTVLMHADLTDLLEALEAKALVPEPESPQSNSAYTSNEDIWGIK